MKIDFIRLQKDINSLVETLNNKELVTLIFICVLFIVELIIHVLIFAHLLMLSGISSIILALLFSSICGLVSFEIWNKHGWSLVPLLYMRWFKSNYTLMKYVVK